MALAPLGCRSLFPMRFTSLIPVSAFAMIAAISLAQVPSANKANWKLADRYSAEALRPFTYSSTVTPGWINKSDTFWYSWRGQDGVHFWKVDCKAKKKGPLFDTALMASQLSV